jgi:hypothetical protein
MTESSITMTGLEELRRGVAQLPMMVTAALKRTAQSTADRVLVNARANLAARTKGQGNTAAALQVTLDEANKQFVVEFGLIRNRPANLPLWLEYGFMLRNGQHQPGIYFMHDAAKAEDARYVSAMEAAALAAVNEALG